jgi:hypothetical protein
MYVSSSSYDMHVSSSLATLRRLADGSQVRTYEQLVEVFVFVFVNVFVY